jgi:hypothetical protein
MKKFRIIKYHNKHTKQTFYKIQERIFFLWWELGNFKKREIYETIEEAEKNILKYLPFKKSVVKIITLE